MSKHTKEPWRTDAPSGFPGDVMAGKEMIARTTITDQSNAKANARRIVACVNACIGYQTEQLEEFGRFISSGEAQAMAEHHKQIEKQRDELLTALESLEKDNHTYQTRPCPTCREITKTLGRPFGCNAKELKAAIAKVKP